MRILAGVLGAIIGSLCAEAQPVCPPINFQQLAQVQLQNRPQKILSGMVRQADQSFSQIEITGNVLTKTASEVAVVPNIQKTFFTCSGLAPRNPKAGPAPTLADPLGTGARNTIVTDLAGNGIGAIVGLDKRGAPNQVVVVTAGPNYTVVYAGGYQVGQTPEGVLAGDFNGDGKPDVAVLYFGPLDNSGPGGISLLLGTGTGTLQPAVNYPSGLNSIAAAAADFNGDGKDDIAVVNIGDSTVTIMLGNATGKLTIGNRYSVGANSFPGGIAIADVNGDGKPDLILETANSLVTMFGNGDGTFRAGASTRLQTSQPFLATGDFNKDGKIDVAVSDFASGILTILTGNGDGTFTTASQYQIGYGPGDVWAVGTFYVEDFDGDGNLDIVFATGHPNALITPPYTQTVSVLFGNGDGTFSGAPVYPITPFRPGSIVTADFNGDGKQDLAIGGGTGAVSVLLGAGGGRFQPGMNLSAPAASGQSAVTAGDLNGDDKIDLAINDGASGAVVFLGKGDGTFQAPQAVAGNGNGTAYVVTGDFHNNKRLDLALANQQSNTVSIVPGKGDGTFGAANSIPVGSNPAILLAGDFNRDGNLDLAVVDAGTFGSANDPGGVSILLGKGDGTFQTAVNYPAGMNPNSISAGDFNHDGITDLVVTASSPSFSGYTLVVFIGNADGTFKQGVMIPTQFGPQSLGVADFSGDGKQDLVVTHCCGDTQITYLLGNGDGTFQAEAPITSVNAFSSVVADFNGDGKPDIALAGEGLSGDINSSAYIFLNLNSTSGCAYMLDSTLVHAPLSGGQFVIRVETSASCAWTVTGLPNWITVSGAASGKGPGSVSLAVAPNGGSSRSVEVFIAGISLTVNEAGLAPVCTYAISPGGQVFVETGGNGVINVTAPTGCAWSASGPPGWVTITSGASGNGNGTVGYMVGSNTGPDRMGSITIAGLVFTVEQVSPSLAGASVAGSMAQIASAGGWKMTITLINTGASAAQIRLNFFDNNGNPLLLPLTFPQSGTSQQPAGVPDLKRAAAAPGAGPLVASTLDRTLSGGASLIIETTGPDDQATLVGWAQLLSTGSVGGFATFTVNASHQEAVVPLEIRNASSYRLAFDNTGGLLTGLAIANLSAQAANIPLIIRDDTGAQIGTPAINLPAHGHTSFMLTDNYAITGGKRGTVEFDTPAGGQISVLGLRAHAPALTTLPLLANVVPGGGSLAHVASAGGWQTGFTFVNAGAASAQITLSFTDDNGNALSLPLSFPQTNTSTTASSVTKTIGPNASLVIQTQGLSAQAVVTGSAHLATTGSVDGFAIFRDGGTLQEAVVPLETRTGGAFLLAFDNTNGLATGLALANISTQSANVGIVLRDDTGAALGSPTINLPGQGHTSFLLTSNYAVTAGKRGTVEFDTPPGGQISALGLRATPAGTLTTIPVLRK